MQDEFCQEHPWNLTVEETITALLDAEAAAMAERRPTVDATNILNCNSFLTLVNTKLCYPPSEDILSRMESVENSCLCTPGPGCVAKGQSLLAHDELYLNAMKGRSLHQLDCLACLRTAGCA